MLYHALFIALLQESRPVAEPHVAQRLAALEERLYGACVKAAEASLRLHESDQARRWLAEAPQNLRGFEWRLLFASSDRSSAHWPLRDSAVTDLAISPDGKQLAVGFGDGCTCLLDAHSGSLLKSLEGPSASIWSPAFSPDGQRLATACSDGFVRLYDLKQGVLLASYPGNGRGVAALDFGPKDLLAVSSWDFTGERMVRGVVSIWDTATGLRVAAFDHGAKPIAALEFTPDGKRLIVGTWDSDVAVFAVGSWELLHRIMPPGNADYQATRDLAVSPDGTTLAVSYADGRARLYDLDSFELKATLDTTTPEALKQLNDICWLADGERLATVGSDGSLRLWGAAGGLLMGSYAGHGRAATTVVASGDGNRLYSAGSEGEVLLFDLAVLEPARDVWSGETAWGAAFDPTGKRVAIACWGGQNRIHDVASGALLSAFDAHAASAVGIDWSRDGRFLLSTGNDGRVILSEIENGELLAELIDHEGQILSALFTHDSGTAIAPAEGSAIGLWSVPDGKRLTVLDDGGSQAGHLALSPDGRILAAAHGDGAVRLWNLAEGRLIARLEGHQDNTTALAFHPLRDELVTGAGSRVRRFKASTGAPLGELPEASSSLYALSFSPDATRIAAGLSNGLLEIWHAESGAVLLRQDHRAGVYTLVFAPDGQTLLAFPMDKTVRAYRAPLAE